MILKIGSKGVDVAKIQRLLGIIADGIFGAATETKVKEWQTKNGLQADGIVGDKTFGKMFAVIPLNEGTQTKTFDFSSTLIKLKGHVPDSLITEISNCSSIFQKSSTLRLTHLLAQCAHESLKFTVVIENLNYSAEGLKKVFPKHFPGNLSLEYARQPSKIASRVYANRLGNSNEASQDGFTYKGRGYIQLTGKANYDSFAKFIGEDTVTSPELVATKYPFASALFYFETNKLWAIRDKGNSKKVITEVSKKVNGGTNGLEDRIANFNTYYKILN
jgi:putative chitinase